MIRPMPLLICILTGYILGSLATSQSDSWGGHGPPGPPGSYAYGDYSIYTRSELNI